MPNWNTNFDFWRKPDEKGYFRSKKEKSQFCVRPCSLLTTLNFSARRPTDNSILMSLLLFLTETIKSANQFEGLLPPNSFESPPFRNSPPIQVQVTIPDWVMPSMKVCRIIIALFKCKQMTYSQNVNELHAINYLQNYVQFYLT